MKYDDVCKKNCEKMSNRPLLVDIQDNSSKNAELRKVVFFGNVFPRNILENRTSVGTFWGKNSK